jgi:hypothetical protein
LTRAGTALCAGGFAGNAKAMGTAIPRAVNSTICEAFTRMKIERREEDQSKI